MLIAREFDLTNQLLNSDGENLSDLSTQTFVAIYDSETISNSAFEQYLDKCIDTECFDSNDDVVILPAKTYNNLNRLIKNNYTIIKK